MQAEQIAELRRILDPARVLHEPADRATYAYDATAGLCCEPDAIVFPASTEEVSALLRFAARESVPVVPRGSGTGLSGGAVPTPGALVICTARFDRILEVDATNRTMLVEPGVITQRIADAAAEHGLFYPPDPGSIRVCTIGGNVAENAGGLRGLKYGVTRDYVMALEVVLPDGEAIDVGSQCVKDVAGYSLKDLFLGSEGTLGIVTRILLKLVARPACKQSLVALFDSIESAAATGTELLRAQVTPCTLEFLDRVTMQSVEEHAQLGLPTDAEAMLLIECDGHPAAVADEMEVVSRVCAGARSVHAADGTKYAEARRTAFAALARRKPVTLLEDATVPRSRLAEMVRFIQEVAQRHELWIGTFGHLGDGNLHPTCLCERDELPRAHEAFREIFGRAVDLGGTITGEHGVGLAKKPYLEQAVGSRPLAIMRELKRAIDPQGLLNPGKIL
ncbi:MAG: FAD-binding oxidoreductase [Planctomycetota bacterium]